MLRLFQIHDGLEIKNVHRWQRLDFVQLFNNIRFWLNFLQENFISFICSVVVRV